MNDIFDVFDDDSNVDIEDIQEGWSQCSDWDDDINFDNYRGQ